MWNIRNWHTAAWIRALVSLLPLLVMLPHTLGLVSYGPVTLVDQRIYDRSMRLFAPDTGLDARIVIVDIDEASLRQVGRWPWHRDTLARLAEELLQRQQVAVLGFDMLFSESEHDDSLARVQAWLRTRPQGESLSAADTQALQQQFAHDQALAQAFRQRPVVLGYYFSSDPQAVQAGVLPRPLDAGGSPPSGFARLHRMTGYTASLPELAAAAPLGGFINATTDRDGVLRSIPLVVQKQADGQAPQYYPALSLAMFMALLQAPQASLQPVDAGAPEGAHKLAGIALMQNNVRMLLPTDVQGNMLVPFRGAGGPGGRQYQYVSAREVLEGKLAPAQLAGKLVLVGTSAPGLRDLRATPVQVNYPGVEVHASALAAMLDGRFIHAPDYARTYSTLMVILAVLVLLTVLPRMGMSGALLWSSGLMALLLATNLWLYARAGIALPLAASLLTVLMTYVLHTSLGYLMERRIRRQLVELFGHYVPAELVARMARSPQTYSMAAQSLEMSVMFCDVRQFTRLSESLPPQELQALLNRLFNRMAEVIAPWRGTIDKYMGDCVMVFWGAPLPDTDHALHAARTALALQAMLDTFNAEQRAAGQPVLEVGIGINTGIMSVGDMGSDMRRSYTVIGDAVNLAARLEALSKRYALAVVAGARTAELAPQYLWQWLDRVRVAGKTQVVDIYTPLGEQPLPPQLDREYTTWQAFCTAYQARDWVQCKRYLDLLQAWQPDKKLYRIHQARIQRFLACPPAADWDGVVPGVEETAKS